MKIAFFLLLSSISIAVAAQDSAQVQLLGKYKFPDGSVVAEVNVTFENGGLMMNSSAGTSTLELIKGDSFNIVNFNGVAVFRRNEVKKVIGVHIDASGYVLDGVKDGATIKAVNAGPSNEWVITGDNYGKNVKMKECENVEMENVPLECILVIEEIRHQVNVQME